MSVQDDLKRQTDKTLADQQMAMAKQAEDRMMLDRRLADEKIAMEKAAEQKRMDEQKNGKKGDELDNMLMAGFTGIMMFSAWEATKDGVKNMLDPNTANDLSKADPHAEVTRFGAATPSSLAGGVASMFGFGVQPGQSTSNLNTRKVNELDPAMNFRPGSA